MASNIFNTPVGERQKEPPRDELLNSGSSASLREPAPCTPSPMAARHEADARTGVLHSDSAAKHGTSAIDLLPLEIARSRIISASDAAKFWGVSLPHWRRLYRQKAVPAPIRLSERRLGWRIGDLIDALAARTAA